MQFGNYINIIINTLNTNKYFYGIIMLILNIGSKFITVNISKSHEEYVQNTIGRELLIFSIAFIGTKDIVTSLILTGIFFMLTDHLFNANSNYCILPKKYKLINKLIDNNNDGDISDDEIKNAMLVLRKAKKQKEILAQKTAFEVFNKNKI